MNEPSDDNMLGRMAVDLEVSKDEILLVEKTGMGKMADNPRL